VTNDAVGCVVGDGSITGSCLDALGADDGVVDSMETPESVLLWRECQELAEAAVDHFCLRGYRGLKATTNRKTEDCGYCHPDGFLELRIHRWGRPTQPLTRRWLKGVLAHELAHLEVSRHGKRHEAKAQEILKYWRQKLNGRNTAS